MGIFKRKQKYTADKYDKFDTDELYDLCYTVVNFILPRLEAYVNMSIVPSNKIDTYDTIITGFKLIQYERNNPASLSEEERLSVDTSLFLFSRELMGMWY